ncbi:MAG TPA: TetR/AcrR family transcriptional regulator [Spirochaetota bacterium]|nr:TetR/AcrR family transcriptional regulator [Spirochaetota bacterium]
MLKHSKEGDETKLKILKAAKKEFAEKGFNGARMSSIASIAGVNQALLHYHFENKENLYRSIFHNTIGDIASEFSEQLSKEIDSWNPTPDIKLCAAIYIMVSINMDSHDDELHRIFAREMAEGQGLLHEFVKNYMMPRLLIFEDIIKDGVARGIFEISDTMLFSLNVVAFINDFAHGEDFLKDTAVYEKLYTNKKEKLYKFMTELSFKALKPAGKELPVPVFDNEKKKRLDLIIEEMSSSLNFA